MRQEDIDRVKEIARMAETREISKLLTSCSAAIHKIAEDADGTNVDYQYAYETLGDCRAMGRYLCSNNRIDCAYIAVKSVIDSWRRTHPAEDDSGIIRQVMGRVEKIYNGFSWVRDEEKYKIIDAPEVEV